MSLKRAFLRFFYRLFGGFLLLFPLLSFTGAVSLASASAPVRLELQYEIEPERSGWLSALVSRFNSAQADVQIRLVPGTEGAKSALMLREISTAPPAGAYRPVYQLLDGAQSASVVPELMAGVADDKGRLNALPLGLSTTVLFYNKAAFKAAGLDPEVPPQTWMDVQNAADKLFSAGSACPYSTSQPAAALIEQLSAWHGEPAFTRGRAPAINGMLQVKHVALMSSWYKSRFFANFGRRDEADAHFAAGECGLLTSGSHLYPRFVEAGVDVGVARLPVHEGHRGAPRHTLVDGLALWVRAGRPANEMRAATRFIRYLMAAETQLQVARDGGFLPFGRAAASDPVLLREAPQQAIALAQIKGGGVAQLGRLPRAREAIDEELEAVWANRKPAKEALDSAMGRIQGGARKPSA